MAVEAMAIAPAAPSKIFALRRLNRPRVLVARISATFTGLFLSPPLIATAASPPLSLPWPARWLRTTRERPQHHPRNWPPGSTGEPLAADLLRRLRAPGSLAGAGPRSSR